MVPRKQARQTVLTGTLKATVYYQMLQVSINTPVLSCIHIPTPLLKFKHTLPAALRPASQVTVASNALGNSDQNKYYSDTGIQEQTPESPEIPGTRDNLSTHIQSAVYNPAKGVIGQAAARELRPSRKWEVLSHDSCAHKHATHLPS